MPPANTVDSLRTHTPWERSGVLSLCLWGMRILRDTNNRPTNNKAKFRTGKFSETWVFWGMGYKRVDCTHIAADEHRTFVEEASIMHGRKIIATHHGVGTGGADGRARNAEHGEPPAYEG